jgi:hypothetical protein
MGDPCEVGVNGERAVNNHFCCDLDGDTYSSQGTCGGNDCNDNPTGGSSINPGVSETYANGKCSNGLDDDCDGFTDDEDDGCSCPEECDEGSTPIESGCYINQDLCKYPGNDGCPAGTFPYGSSGCCCTTCPIIIDVAGNGYSLSDLETGVNFDHNNDGIRERISWTASGSDDAFLVLDRNGNGSIDAGRELFGNTTPQPFDHSIADPNGFIALAEFDKPSSGGNRDGRISQADAIFPSLRLWQDVNHNGTSEAGELHRLRAVGVAFIDLDYKESRRSDSHGNLFKYRAKVRDTRGAQLGRWAWDVFLLRGQ